MNLNEQAIDYLEKIYDKLEEMRDSNENLEVIYNKFLQELLKQTTEILPRMEKQMDELRMRIVALETKK